MHDCNSAAVAVGAAAMFFLFRAAACCATATALVYSFSRRDFRYYSSLVFAARLSILQFTRFRGATLEIAVLLVVFVFEYVWVENTVGGILGDCTPFFCMQFTSFRGSTLEIAFYLFSRRDCPCCRLLVFAARLSKLQFTSCRSANFETAVSSFSLRYFRNCSLLIFAARLSKVQFSRFRGATFDIAVYSQFTSHNVSSGGRSAIENTVGGILGACSPRTPKKVQKCFPKPPKSRNK